MISAQNKASISDSTTHQRARSVEDGWVKAIWTDQVWRLEGRKGWWMGSINAKGRWIDIHPKGRSKVWKARVVGREEEKDQLRRGRRGYLYPRYPGRKALTNGGDNHCGNSEGVFMAL